MGRALLIKRLFDILVSAGVLFIFSPVAFLIGILIHWKLGAPVFFTQKRIGKNGSAFEVIKFRSMLDSTDSIGKPLPDVDRLTKFGMFLRSISLDEFPEFWNVIKGDMSIVGPRPLLMQYLNRYTPEQARRHDVKPGLTGWAQINGRNAISWEEKFKLDVWYVDHQSIWLDLKIIGLTIKKVFRREGISAAGEATMPEFMGSAFKEVVDG